MRKIIIYDDVQFCGMRIFGQNTPQVIAMISEF
jgi:hypothetical protein